MKVLGNKTVSAQLIKVGCDNLLSQSS